MAEVTPDAQGVAKLALRAERLMLVTELLGLVCEVEILVQGVAVQRHT